MVGGRKFQNADCLPQFGALSHSRFSYVPYGQTINIQFYGKMICFTIQGVSSAGGGRARTVEERMCITRRDANSFVRS